MTNVEREAAGSCMALCRHAPILLGILVVSFSGCKAQTQSSTKPPSECAYCSEIRLMINDVATINVSSGQRMLKVLKEHRDRMARTQVLLDENRRVAGELKAIAARLANSHATDTHQATINRRFASLLSELIEDENRMAEYNSDRLKGQVVQKPSPQSDATEFIRIGNLLDRYCIQCTPTSQKIAINAT